MLYEALRVVARVALRWYYGEIVVQGEERIPAAGPVLVASNHPNALVDALVVGTAVRRRVLLTAKATLFDHPLLAPLLHAVGVVPLRRASDERAAVRGVAPTPTSVPVERNTDAFQAVTAALCGGGVVLVFPEGISHDKAALAPLKTGTARMALAAADAGARGLVIVPFGIVFEEKERHRSRVLVRVGEPIGVDAWRAAERGAGRAGDAGRLTAQVDAALRRVTLNFASAERARRVVALARALAAIVEAPPALSQARELALEAALATRVEAAADALAGADPAVVHRADEFIARVETLERRLAERGAHLADVQVSLSLRHGAQFVLREGALVVVGLPVAALGRLTHWVPMRVARILAMRPLAHDPSRDQPAMRTIVLGAGCLFAWYVGFGALLARWLGAAGALLVVVAAFLAAGVDFALGDRLRRAWHRARTYRALRADPVLRADALEEMRALLADARALEQDLERGGERLTHGPVEQPAEAEPGR